MNGQKGQNTGIIPHIPSETTVPLCGMKPTAKGLSALRESWMDKIVDLISGVPPSVGEVRSQTDWDPVWTEPNSTVPVPVWDFPKNTGPLGSRSGHSHIAPDRLRPGLDWDHMTYISYMLIFFF